MLYKFDIQGRKINLESFFFLNELYPNKYKMMIYRIK